MHLYDGYYLIPIKENNPAVLRNLIEFFEDEGIDRGEFQYYKDVNKVRGRPKEHESNVSPEAPCGHAQNR